MGFQELSVQVRVPDKEFFPETYAKEFVVFLNTQGPDVKSDIIESKRLQILAKRAFREREKFNIRHSEASLRSSRGVSMKSRDVSCVDRDTVVSTLAPLPGNTEAEVRTERQSTRGRSVSFHAQS